MKFATTPLLILCFSVNLLLSCCVSLWILLCFLWFFNNLVVSFCLSSLIVLVLFMWHIQLWSLLKLKALFHLVWDSVLTGVYKKSQMAWRFLLPCSSGFFVSFLLCKVFFRWFHCSLTELAYLQDLNRLGSLWMWWERNGFFSFILFCHPYFPFVWAFCSKSMFRDWGWCNCSIAPCECLKNISKEDTWQFVWFILWGKSIGLNANIIHLKSYCLLLPWVQTWLKFIEWFIMSLILGNVIF